jgi:hypothetical protein
MCVPRSLLSHRSRLELLAVCGDPAACGGPKDSWSRASSALHHCTSTSATEAHYTSFKALIISSAAICTNDGVVQHYCLRRLNSTMSYPVTPI